METKMIERLKHLHTELRDRACLNEGTQYSDLYAGRAEQVSSWIESLENGWPINTDYVGTAATEFEKMCGLCK
jgi:hypothetical protein